MNQKSTKKIIALMAVSLILTASASPAFAQTSETEKGVTGFFRRLFNWGPKTVKNTADMTSNTLNNTGEKVVAKTGENTKAVLTGQMDKTPNLVTDPVVGTLETAGQTAQETVEAPVKAAEEEPTA